jgi:two-component system LytT family response regulator
MKLRCIAVDDEPLARRMLKENIAQIPFLELVGTCKNAFEAMELLEREKIDLIFLDIQMPGMIGTKFIQSMHHNKPMVIFVTAYSNYAVESYELEVIDYLLKPVSLERFTKAAYKALERRKKNENPTPKAIDTQESPESFFVKVEYALVKIILKEITHIEGMKDYVKIFLTTANRPVLTKSTLKGISEKLPLADFMRIHKSYIVRLDKIESIRGNTLTIGKYEIPVSESQKTDLLDALDAV